MTNAQGIKSYATGAGDSYIFCLGFNSRFLCHISWFIRVAGIAHRAPGSAEHSSLGRTRPLFLPGWVLSSHVFVPPGVQRCCCLFQQRHANFHVGCIKFCVLGRWEEAPEAAVPSDGLNAEMRHRTSDGSESWPCRGPL